MLVFNQTLIEIVIRTSLVYVMVLIGMRITGKKEVGQMTPFDLVLFLLIANAVQNAMTGPDTSLTGGLTAAATLLILNTIMTWVSWRFRRLESWIDGTPTVLIHHGEILEPNLKRERVSRLEVEQALREHGIFGPEEVEIAMLEIDGSISVLRKNEMPTTVKPHHRIRFHRQKS